MHPKNWGTLDCWTSHKIAAHIYINFSILHVISQEQDSTTILFRLDVTHYSWPIRSKHWAWPQIAKSLDVKMILFSYFNCFMTYCSILITLDGLVTCDQLIQIRHLDKCPSISFWPQKYTISMLFWAKMACDQWSQKFFQIEWAAVTCDHPIYSK